MTVNLARDGAAIRRLFARIARHYDRMNRLMTLGQDQRWRGEVLRRACLAPGCRVLDLGSGTGELARQALAREPRLQVVALDLTPEMIRLGRSRPGARSAAWVMADALHLPFASDVFEAVLSAFLLRNVPDVEIALREQSRVLRPGGRMIALDTTPAVGWLRPLLRLYLGRVVPALARLLTGQAGAYSYLAASTDGFVPAPQLARHFERAGLQQVGFVRRGLGAVAIHWGRKP